MFSKYQNKKLGVFFEKSYQNSVLRMQHLKYVVFWIVFNSQNFALCQLTYKNTQMVLI